MVKVAGRRMGSMKSVRSSLKKGGGNFIKGVNEDGITVRFLTEPDGWWGYKEHYDEGLKSFYPCVEGNCPGCAQDLRPSFKYLTNAVDLDDKSVIPLKLAKDAANRVVMKFDKYGTIMDRNYELTRSGSGFDTIYDVSTEAPRKMIVSKYELLDLEKVLQDAFDLAFNEQDDEEEDGDDEDEEDERPRRRSATPGRATTSTASTKRRVAARKSTPPPARRVATQRKAATVKKPVRHSRRG